MLRSIVLVVAALTATAAASQTAPATAVSPAPPAAPAAVAPAQTPAELAKIRYQSEIICKTSTETGSLIAKRKTCLTRKQWRYVEEQQEDRARKYVEDGTTRPN